MPIHLNHNYGEISIYDNYIISTIKEGVTITPKINDVISNLIAPHFKNKTYCYIANRIYSYAVDPSVYKDISKIKDLIGIAVVSSNRIALNNAELEKIFINKPFEVFYTLEDAQKWVDEIMS